MYASSISEWSYLEADTIDYNLFRAIFWVFVKINGGNAL